MIIPLEEQDCRLRKRCLWCTETFNARALFCSDVCCNAYTTQADALEEQAAKKINITLDKLNPSISKVVTPYSLQYCSNPRCKAVYMVESDVWQCYCSPECEVKDNYMNIPFAFRIQNWLDWGELKVNGDWEIPILKPALCNLIYYLRKLKFRFLSDFKLFEPPVALIIYSEELSNKQFNKSMDLLDGQKYSAFIPLKYNSSLLDNWLSKNHPSSVPIRFPRLDQRLMLTNEECKRFIRYRNRCLVNFAHEFIIFWHPRLMKNKLLYKTIFKKIDNTSKPITFIDVLKAEAGEQQCVLEL